MTSPEGHSAFSTSPGPQITTYSHALMISRKFITATLIGFSLLLLNISWFELKGTGYNTRALKEALLAPQVENTSSIVELLVPLVTKDVIPLPPVQARALDIVLAYYHNDNGNIKAAKFQEIPNVAGRKPAWYLYNKNSDPTPSFGNLKSNYTLINLPNVGREGHTFLHHMVQHYDNLANHTVFCQEEPHNFEQVLFRLRTFLNDNTGFLSLGHLIRCTCNGCSASFTRLKDFYAMFTNQTCSGDFTASLSGCFAVSKRIQRIPVQKLEELLALFEAPADHPIHSQKDYDITPCTPESPCFGHMMKRLWSVLFGCSGMDVYKRRQCNKAGCGGPQCLD